MTGWHLTPKKKKEEPPKPTPPATPKASINYGAPHDQLIADLIKGLQDGTIVMRSINAQRTTSNPWTELMLELWDMRAAPPPKPSAAAVMPSMTGATGAQGVPGSAGMTGATGPVTPQVYHLGHSAVTAVTPSFSSAVTTPISMVAQVAALPGAKTYGMKQSTSTEPIVGYRDFSLIQGLYGLALQSRNGAIWPPRKKMRALCGGNPFAPHDVPDPGCQCGIYAYDAPDHTSLKRDNSSLWAEIAMWGDVLVCEEGYRSEFAYPTALFMRKPAMPGNRTTRVLEGVREELEDTYGVPVFILAERASKTASQLMQEILQEQIGDLLNATKEEDA